ncbi:hypothetical protein [Halovivax sp.]|uniref:hypothetical protein n=1 Tax=Halovivax sp. TaxID=1935978 RepID=UPI0025BC6834|nr:hypothetical protein [Halovivax sp.]
MKTVGDCFVRDRRSDRVALVDGSGREYDAHWLCTSSWKAGNFLRHTGVRRGVTVGVVGDGPLALLAFFGTALLEGGTRFDPPMDLASAEDLRTLVAPADAVTRYQLPPGAQRVCYGGDPPAPDVHHFDAGLWSENPSFPPLSIDSGTPLLVDSEGAVTHGEAMAAAGAVAEEYGIDAGTRVAVRAPLSDLRTVIAGILAPLAADGVIVLGDPSGTSEIAVFADGEGGQISDRVIPLDAVALDGY